VAGSPERLEATKRRIASESSYMTDLPARLAEQLC
jgi:hypothetical protein